MISASMAETILFAVERVKARGGTVSFDPNVRREIVGDSVPPDLLAVLAQTDLFLPSGDELMLFSTAVSADAAIAEMLDRGVSAIVHKQGARGARYVDRGTDVFVPGIATTEIDPTGAGDIFGATFVVGWLSGLEPEPNLRRANAAGSLAVRRRGPMEGASSVKEIEALLEGQDLSSAGA
jgi:sugar/nucleoside kinase (ribokinase family)